MKSRGQLQVAHDIVSNAAFGVPEVLQIAGLGGDVVGSIQCLQA